MTDVSRRPRIAVVGAASLIGEALIAELRGRPRAPPPQAPPRGG